MEEQQIDHCARDISVGQIENRAEEVVVVIDQEREPLGAAVPLEEREVEHIDHLTHQECAVTLAQRRHREGCRGGEDHAVEHRIDQITNRTGKNQRQADEYAARGATLGACEVVDVVTQRTDHHHAEEAQHQLAPVDSATHFESHTERRAAVLDKVEVEPREDLDRLVEAHRGLNPNFQDLVEQEQHQNHYCYVLQFHNLRFWAKVRKIPQTECLRNFLVLREVIYISREYT